MGKRLIPLFAIFIFACTFPYSIDIENNFGQDIYIKFCPDDIHQLFRFDGLGDTTLYKIKNNEIKRIRTDAYYFVYEAWDYELKPVFVLNANSDTLQIYRISTTFFNQQDYKIKLPFDALKLGPLYDKELTNKDLRYLSKNDKKRSKLYQKYNRIQYYYNTGQFEKSLLYTEMLLLEFFEKNYSIFNDKRIPRKYNTGLKIKCGLATIGFLSAAKLEDYGKIQFFNNYLKEYFPEYWEISLKLYL